MKIIADLHIHSHYSRATSKDLNFEQLSKWAQLKGVHVVGTGDIAHPGWLEEMHEKLEPAEDGLFRLKQEFAQPIQAELPDACHGTVRFMLAGEISNIYKKNGKVRKIHNVVFLPTLEAVEKFQRRLEKIGNIRSDGRPILGLDARDLLEIVLETDPQAHFIPAHIWTPWFSLFGSKSGFDSIEECFEDLTEHIFALETGLSSDPPMNWQWSALDRFTLVSNSDAHSPPKLAREANIFHTELSYQAMFDALKTGEKFGGTIEFFPEEGKYHYDGHRKCGICWHPNTTLAHSTICPKCGKPVTVGVMHRVAALADREEGIKPERWHPFTSLIPLPEILSQVHGVGAGSKRVKTAHLQLLEKLGPELFVLQEAALDDIERYGGSKLAEGIRRMRNEEVTTNAGFDGEYGIIKLFEKDESDTFSSQLTLFAKPESVKEDKAAYGSSKPSVESAILKAASEKQFSARQNIAQAKSLNENQLSAIHSKATQLLVLAGPGTGKTLTLTHRMAHFIQEKSIDPGNLLAITFTNKAAEEMRQRMATLCGATVAKRIVIKTFHAFGAMLLREYGGQLDIENSFVVLNDKDRSSFIAQLFPDMKPLKRGKRYKQFSEIKNLLGSRDEAAIAKYASKHPEFIRDYQIYSTALQRNHLLDFDDLLLQSLKLLQKFPALLAEVQQRFQWISVDEYQDINQPQYQLLRLLTPPQTNLCVIGDSDQAIYGFRGADRSYFLRFREDYPNAEMISLVQNYRSTQNILNASRQVISKEDDRDTTEIWSEIASKTKISIYQAPTGKAEAEYIVHQIEKMVGGTSYFSLDSGRVDEGGGYSFADFAVLYRLNAQADDLVEAFARSGIPFQTSGQTPFFDQAEIKDMIAYLSLAQNPNSLFHLERIFYAANGNERFGSFENIRQYAEDNSLSLWETVQRYEDTACFTDAQKTWLSKAMPLLWELRQYANRESVASFIQKIYDFSKIHHHLPWSEDAETRIQHLIYLAAAYENRLTDFLENAALQREADEYDPRADRITLMTIHAAKGLEFPVVFIVGCEESLLPFYRKGMKSDADEERRLFYVGMTRAKSELILTHSKSRMLGNRKLENKPSRFLDDIEAALKSLQKTEKRPRKPEQKDDDSQLSLF